MQINQHLTYYRKYATNILIAYKPYQEIICSFVKNNMQDIKMFIKKHFWFDQNIDIEASRMGGRHTRITQISTTEDRDRHSLFLVASLLHGCFL